MGKTVRAFLTKVLMPTLFALLFSSAYAATGFRISLSPSSLQVTQGGTGVLVLTLTPKGEFGSPRGTGEKVTFVLLDANNRPFSGVSLSPTTVSVRGAAPVKIGLTLRIDPNLPPRAYSLKFRATYGKLVQEARLSLNVLPGPGFSIRLEPDRITLTQGEAKKVKVVLQAENGFGGTVNLELVNAPLGLELSPRTLSVSTNRRVQVELTLTAGPETPVGQSTLTLRAAAASGGIQRTLTLVVTINKPLVFVVNTTQDTIDADPGDGKCGDANGNCSIRAAVMEANALNAPVVISIPAGIYLINRQSPVDDQGGDLNLRTPVTLKGASRDQTILDGDGKNRIIYVHEGARVVLEGVTVRNGNAGYGGGIYNQGILTLSSVSVSQNQAQYLGGAIYNQGTLFLSNATVNENTTGGRGGGIFSSGNLTLSNAVLNGNAANEHGGGIYDSGNLTITSSTISGNKANGVGGGIYNERTLNVADSTINGNTARAGGGIYNYAGTVVLTNSTVSGNSADNSGGGIQNASSFVVVGTLILINSTISGNTASSQGGGIYLDGQLTASFSTITGNSVTESNGQGGGFYLQGSKKVQLKGVILALNTASQGPECYGALESKGYNLIKSNAECTFTRDRTDILNQDPLLGSLGDNGGFVQTHLPQAGSPVLDKVPPTSCTDLRGNPVSADARGVRRPQGSACDIGAVERN